jgi:hypothetical protein
MRRPRLPAAARGGDAPGYATPVEANTLSASQSPQFFVPEIGKIAESGASGLGVLPIPCVLYVVRFSSALYPGIM